MHGSPPRPTGLKPSRPTGGSIPLWAHLPKDNRQQLRDLLGRLLARLHEARRLGEAGHE
jgi:hypothetical protein